MTIEEILAKLNTGDFEIECRDGNRKICVDRYVVMPCWAVTVFEVVGTYWDSDYRMNLPVRDFKSQRNFLIDLDAAEYIMGLL